MGAKRIRVLTKDISEKIAAGEVIERPVSIVKELVENSIDAGAKSISVDIKKGGKTYIRITDDGQGIPADQVEVAFMRHGTSKILSEEDLTSIDTLGFRGEALTSIAAVSRTELITKTEDETVGTRITVEGGEITGKKGTGTPVGTTVIVRDLFYNTPARLEFMKSDNSESSAIIEFVSQIALAYPEIRVRMKSNDRFLFSTKGDGDRGGAITALSSKEHAESLIHFTESDEEQHLLIDGYVSGPGDNTKGRKRQIFFVNGRVVDSRLIRDAVDDGYNEKMFEGRHPIAYIFLTVNPEVMDVNIHPNKREVRFHRDDIIHDFIRDSVRNAIDSNLAVPDVFSDIAPRLGNSTPFKKRPDIKKTSQGADNVYDKDTGPEMTDGEKQETEKGKNTFRSGGSKGFRDTAQVDIKEVLSQFRQGTTKVKEEFDAYKASIYEKKEGAAPDFPSLEIMGTVFDTYVLAKDGDCLYIVDQHAAHERVLYESILNSYENGNPARQQIMVPVTIESFREEGPWLQTLNDYGFSVSSLGPGIYKATEIPMDFTLEETRLFLEEFMESIDESKDFKNISVVENCAMRACKAAVKANDKLGRGETEALLKSLAGCENPYTCPHGRPTFIKITERDLEKRFRRV